MENKIQNDLGTLIERWRTDANDPFSPTQAAHGGQVRMADADELEAALTALPPAPPQGRKCWNRDCEEAPTREFCYAAEGWTAYCPNHQAQYVTAGDRPLAASPPAQEQDKETKRKI